MTTREPLPADDIGFGTRLRLERERRRITLASIAANTKISLSLLQGLEREDVSRWPSGIFRRSFIRSYAEAIGLDAEAVAREFLERFPDPAGLQPFDKPAPARPRTASGETVLRLTLADPSPGFIRGRILAQMRRRLGAITWDMGLLVAVGGMLFVALGQFWMPFAIATLGYYATSILILGNTPGVSLFASTTNGGGGGTPMAPLAGLGKSIWSAARRAVLLERFSHSTSAAGPDANLTRGSGHTIEPAARPGIAGANLGVPARTESAVFLAEEAS